MKETIYKKFIDITDEKFWDVLFDEACVEGQQAERIEKKLNKIFVDEHEIKDKAIDEFVKEIAAEYNNDFCPNVTDILDYEISIRDLFKIADELKESNKNILYAKDSDIDSDFNPEIKKTIYDEYDYDMN